MPLKLFSLILASVSLSAIAQVILKIGMTSPVVKTALANNADWPRLFFSIFTNPYILTGFLMYITGAVLWLFVLSKMDVGLAYPFIGIGFILTMLIGATFLDESLNTSRILGALLVVAGVTLLSTQVSST